LKPEFEDVKKCKTMEELNEFIRRYLDKNELKGEARKKAYWALFHAWKESLKLAET